MDKSGRAAPCGLRLAELSEFKFSPSEMQRGILQSFFRCPGSADLCRNPPSCCTQVPQPGGLRNSSMAGTWGRRTNILSIRFGDLIVRCGCYLCPLFLQKNRGEERLPFLTPTFIIEPLFLQFRQLAQNLFNLGLLLFHFFA